MASMLWRAICKHVDEDLVHCHLDGGQRENLWQINACPCNMGGDANWLASILSTGSRTSMYELDSFF